RGGKRIERTGRCLYPYAEADWEDAPVMPAAFKEALRIIFHGTLIYSGKYTKARAEEALTNGWADLIGFGRPFIAMKWFTEFGHLNRGDMLTSEQHRCHNEKKKFQRRV